MANDLPSARAISDVAFRGPDGKPSQRNLTTIFAFFSQVVAYEIMQATQISCPLEVHKIPVPKCDRVFDSQCEGKTEIPFVRAKYDKATGHGINSPREQVGQLEPWNNSSKLLFILLDKRKNELDRCFFPLQHSGALGRKNNEQFLDPHFIHF
jgi:dual oxidase